MSVAMATLWFRGGGLPMNAFPPPRFVSSGLYSLVPHPIYGGFVLACAGVSIMTGSGTGLWIATPLVAMCCSALVLGYELPDLRRRFGPTRSSLWLAADTKYVPEMIERLRVYLVVLLPWLVIYQAIGWLGPSSDAIASYLPFEKYIPVWQGSEVIYGSAYPVVLLTPLLVRTGSDLRQFALRGLMAMALIFPLYFLLPLTAPARPFVSTTVWGDLLVFERSFSKGAAAFPSFHVVWALIAADALGGNSALNRWAWQIWAILLGASCITTGMHSIADVVAGFATFLLVCRLPAIWFGLLRIAEKIANSWKEWRFGPVRVINHGAYAGLAVLGGISIIGALIEPRSEWLLISVFICATLGALAWAQWVEGSPSLLRPLGFYGGLLGSIVGTLLAFPIHISMWVSLAAICTAAPWLQGIGRLRCLVQGCCHGRDTHTVPGIRYTHPRSRVSRLTTFCGVPVHATPLYSILWNGVVGCVLIRLVSLQAAATTMCGAYLILSGVGRFVEEAYRGEPQTLVISGLRFYQWAAVATVVAGCFIITLRGPQLPGPHLSAWAFSVAFVCGLIAWFVSGVDFPESSRRFARLT
jgi:prolipoprotein diacylglyceryltransferase